MVVMWVYSVWYVGRLKTKLFMEIPRAISPNYQGQDHDLDTQTDFDIAVGSWVKGY